MGVATFVFRRNRRVEEALGRLDRSERLEAEVDSLKAVNAKLLGRLLSAEVRGTQEPSPFGGGKVGLCPCVRQMRGCDLIKYADFATSMCFRCLGYSASTEQIVKSFENEWRRVDLLSRCSIFAPFRLSLVVQSHVARFLLIFLSRSDGKPFEIGYVSGRAGFTYQMRNY